MPRRLVLIAAAAIMWSTLSAAQCRSGDHLIGEDQNAYYCSSKTCGQLKGQLELDKEALRRLQKNILDTNEELQKWTKENDKAAESAFRRAGTLLHDAALGSLEKMSRAQLSAITKEVQGRAPHGQTWQRLLERTAELENRRAKWKGIADALSLSQYPFSNLTSAYADLQGWAKDANREVDGISATLAEMRKDPEGAKILNENGVAFVSDGLKLRLVPLVSQGLSLGEFFVNYGYDATAWYKSRELIVQNIEIQDKNRIPVCKLSAQLQKTVRDNNICAGKYPQASTVVQNPQDCE